MTRQPLSVPIMVGTRPRRDTGYRIAVGTLVLMTVIAVAIGPGPLTLLPLALYAWGVAWWTIARETKPRYRRH